MKIDLHKIRTRNFYNVTFLGRMALFNFRFYAFTTMLLVTHFPFYFTIFAGKKDDDEEDSNDVASLLREALQQQDV